MSHPGHQRVECRRCGVTVRTCRCMGPKPTRYVDRCNACLEAVPTVHTRLHGADVGPHEIPGELPEGEKLIFTVALAADAEHDRMWVMLNDKPVGPPVADEATGVAVVQWFMGYLSQQVSAAVDDHVASRATAPKRDVSRQN